MLSRDLRKVLDAVDLRIGHRALIREALHEVIPGGASFAYVFGSAALVLFGVQVVTGIVLAMYYSPSTTAAWASIAFLEREITMGALVRGMHHHTAGGMVVIMILHAAQVVFFGSYKAPREANWLTGLALFGLVFAFALTGYLLPWDQTGYWATKVATSILGTLPVVGPDLQRIAQGGNDYGNLTLTRFYTIHVILLPLLTTGLIGVHVALFRKHGVTPPASMAAAELESNKEPFWPRQVAYDAIFAFAVTTLIAYLAIRVGAPLEAPADPSSTFIARPEWYFLFLFELLKYFEGPLQIVGTAVIPGIALAVLAAVPFLDPGRSRSLRARRRGIGVFAGGLLFVVLLTSMALRQDAGDPKIAAQRVRASREAARARELASSGVPVSGAGAMMAHDPMTRGERVFERECLSCHVLDGHGPKTQKAPDLTGYRSRAWIRQVLRDSESSRLFGPTKVEGMKSFSKLAETDLRLLVDLIYAERNPGAPPVEERAGFLLLEEHKCTDCHDFKEAYGLEGPSLFGYGSRKWVEEVVSDAGAAHLYGDMNTMPAFLVRLSSEDRDAVVTFVLSLEARTPSDRWPAVDDPVSSQATGNDGH